MAGETCAIHGESDIPIRLFLGKLKILKHRLDAFLARNRRGILIGDDNAGGRNFEMTTAAGIVLTNHSSTNVSCHQGTQPVFEYFELAQK